MCVPSTETIHVESSFDYSPTSVFAAWVDPQVARRWLFATPTGHMGLVETDPQVGGGFRIIERRDGEDVEHLGTSLAVERPNRLAFDFTVPKYSDQSSRVTIEISPEGTGSTLTLHHEGVLPEWKEPTLTGWTQLLQGLRATLEAAKDDPRERVREIVESFPGAYARPVADLHLRLEVAQKKFGWYMENHHGDERLQINCKALPGVPGGLSLTPIRRSITCRRTWKRKVGPVSG